MVLLVLFLMLSVSLMRFAIVNCHIAKLNAKLPCRNKHESLSFAAIFHDKTKEYTDRVQSNSTSCNKFEIIPNVTQTAREAA